MWKHLMSGGLLCLVLAIGYRAAGPEAQDRRRDPVAASDMVTWTAAEWVKARRLSPLPPPPIDLTNALSDNLSAARLGHRLFFDTRLSPQGIACAACHVPERGFSDGLPVANTLAPSHRNTMTIVNSAYYRWLTWDGGRDSLWHQAVAPFENPKEMGSSRLYVVRTVMQHYGSELEKIVALPAGWQQVWPTLPMAGKPGEGAFDTLPAAHQEQVNQVFTSILKTIAAYERQVVSVPAPFDRYVAGDAMALSPAAQRGFQAFLRFECDTCHNTPLFSDDEFHNLGLSTPAAPDSGRAEGLPQLQQSRFRGTRPYADGPPVVRAEDYRTGAALVGSFRTPSLREIQETAPYGHNGSVATLDKWLDHYENVTSLPPEQMLGSLDPALPPTTMTEQEQHDLIEFLHALSSDYTSVWTRAPQP